MSVGADGLGLHRLMEAAASVPRPFDNLLIDDCHSALHQGSQRTRVGNSLTNGPEAHVSDYGVAPLEWEELRAVPSEVGDRCPDALAFADMFSECAPQLSVRDKST